MQMFAEGTNLLITAHVRLRPKFKKRDIIGICRTGCVTSLSPTRRGGAKQIEAQRPGGLLGFSRARPSGAPLL